MLRSFIVALAVSLTFVGCMKPGMHNATSNIKAQPKTQSAPAQIWQYSLWNSEDAEKPLQEVEVNLDENKEVVALQDDVSKCEFSVANGVVQIVITGTGQNRNNTVIEGSKVSVKSELLKRICRAENVTPAAPAKK